MPKIDISKLSETELHNLIEANEKYMRVWKPLGMLRQSIQNAIVKLKCELKKREKQPF